MPGPQPKSPEVRQRRNKASTRATLPAEGARELRRRTPALPKRKEVGPNGRTRLQKWDPLTVAWWKDLWRSPMSARFLKADLHQLYILAVLMDRFWNDDSPTLAAEIRQQAMRFGLDSMARRRLEWEIKADSQVKAPAKAKKRPVKGKKDDRRFRILRAG